MCLKEIEVRVTMTAQKPDLASTARLQRLGRAELAVVSCNLMCYAQPVASATAMKLGPACSRALICR